jgi:putative aldouronate transport system permease protein
VSSGTLKSGQDNETIEITGMLPGGSSEVVRKKSKFMRHMMRNWEFYLMMLIPIIFYVVIRYIPMAGNIIAFRKYNPGASIFGSENSGLKYFEMFLKQSVFWVAFRNTLILNISYLAIRFPMTLIFALLLNEIRTLRWKKFVQTISYLPHFISTVIVAGMIIQFVSLEGPINNLMAHFGYEKIMFLVEPDWFVSIFVTSGLWQGLGWGTILYLAAISNINPNLYEAAEVDGASHLQKVLNVTIPCILPTIATLFILDIGGLAGSGMAFEKVFLLSSPTTYETSDILSTFVFRMGIKNNLYSYATAVGLFEGVINLTLLTVANQTAKRLTGTSLW